MNRQCTSPGKIPREVRQAFTLIEMLVVIAIISILASLLMPALRNARDNAYSAYCGNNLRQIFTQFEIYASDHEDLIPWPHTWPGMPGPKATHVNWRDMLTESMGSVPKCPVGSGAYGINDFGSGQCWGTTLPPFPRIFAVGTGTKFNHFVSASGTYLMADNSVEVDPPYITPWIRGREPIAGWPDGEVTDVAYRHMGGCNMLFCDGHVEWLKGPLAGYNPAADDRAVTPWHNTCHNPPGFGPNF